MFKKLIDKLDEFILKHHKCENNKELFSITKETFGSYEWITSIKFKCGICNKFIK